jgi:hypothetical protein
MKTWKLLNSMIMIFLLYGGQVSAQPNLKIPESTYNFGYVPQNAKISHSYWLYSTGEDTLIIEKVSPGCGCIQAPLAKNRLASGDSVALEITFNTGHYRGYQSKRPAIKSNAGAELNYVQFTCNVFANPDSVYPISVSPYKFDISQFGEKKRNSLDFSVANLSDADLELRLVDSPANMFEVSLPKKIKAGKSGTGKIIVRNEYLNSEFEKSITIEASDSEKTRFTIPVKRAIRVSDPNQPRSVAPGEKRR